MIPLFLGLLLCVFETARFMAVYGGISNGVRAGARVATIPNSTDDQIKDTVVAAMILTNTATVRSSVTITPNTRVPRGSVTVSASYPFTFNPLIHGMISSFGLGTITISQSETATVEGP
jgi:Flp pilus assembly protein TadG